MFSPNMLGLNLLKLKKAKTDIHCFVEIANKNKSVVFERPIRNLKSTIYFGRFSCY